MHATRAAVEEGIVPGGGVALLLPPSTSRGFAPRTTTRRPASRSSEGVVLSSPQIAINAGEDGSIIVGKILEKDQYSYGFDSQTGEYVNLISGIIDPTKVVRVAIQNAASVAAALITTEAMVAEVPRRKNAAAACLRVRRHGRMGVWISKFQPFRAQQ